MSGTEALHPKRVAATEFGKASPFQNSLFKMCWKQTSQIYLCEWEELSQEWGVPLWIPIYVCGVVKATPWSL